MAEPTSSNIVTVKTDPTPPPAVDHEKENADLKAQIAALQAKLDAPKPADDLIEKARKEREQSEREAGKVKRLSDSIRFNDRVADFVKTNAPILPKDAGDILAAANKETYADDVEKTDAIKSNLIQSFFSVQANLEVLTAGQRAALDEYLKLTKNGKLERAQSVFEMVFEPAFETLKKLKKADALNKGLNVGSDDDAFKQKMIAANMKRFRLEKR